MKFMGFEIVEDEAVPDGIAEIRNPAGELVGYVSIQK